MILVICLSVVLMSSTTLATTHMHTTPPTTVTTACCFADGIHYNQGETISEGRVDNWYYGLMCGSGCQIIHWDYWNCGTTTPTPSTYIPKCVYGTNIYLPGQEITTWNDSSTCYTLTCGENSVIHTSAHCNCFNAGHTAAAYCRIDDVCYQDGEPNPVEQCQICLTASSTSHWSPAPLMNSTMQGVQMSCEQVCNIYSQFASKVNFYCKFAKLFSGYEMRIYKNICVVEDPALVEQLVCEDKEAKRMCALCTKLLQPGGILEAMNDALINCQ